jgi:hypothetical protein
MKYLILPFVVLVSFSLGNSQEGGKLVINHFISDPDFVSRVYVTDFDGVGPEVVVTFYSEQGEIIGQKSVRLPQNGTVPLKPFDIIQRRAVGNVRIDGKGVHVAGEYWQIIEDEDFSYSVATPGQPATGNNDLIVQHFVSDPDLNTIIFLTNPNDGPSADVSLEFHSEGGEVLSRVERSIGPNATLVLKPFDVIQRRAYGNVHIKATGATVTGEYWQLVDVKKDGKEEKYGVAVPLQTLRFLGR